MSNDPKDKPDNVINLFGNKKSQQLEPTQPHPSFQGFVQQIVQGNLDAATSILQTLLNLPEESSRSAVNHFADGIKNKPGFAERAMKLRMMIGAAEPNECLKEIVFIFGIGGPEAVQVYSELVERLRQK